MEIRTVVERRAAPQTVVHNHITQVIQRQVPPRRDMVYRLFPQPGEEADTEWEERSRPTLAAQRLIRLFSTESARRELMSFFRTVVRTVLDEERAFHLNGAEYQALIRGIERSLNRESRLKAIRQGRA